MQKELLKGSVGSNETNTKSSAPATKKLLTVETDSGTGVPLKTKENSEKDAYSSQAQSEFEMKFKKLFNKERYLAEKQKPLKRNWIVF